MKLRYTIAGLMLIAGISSCKKQITYAPKDATYDAIFWINGSNASQALAGAYGLLRSALTNGGNIDPNLDASSGNGNTYFICGDMPVGSLNSGAEFILDGTQFWNYQDLIFPKLNYGYTPYLTSYVSDWSNFYKVINQCHLITENTPNIPDEKFDGGADQKASIIAQAKFLRAYTYFYITRIWGDPVVTKESLKDPASVQPLPRSSESDALAYAIEDAKEASSILSFVSDKSSADKGAALTLLAEIYAWQHDYANTSLYCDSVINSGQYSLEDSSGYKNIWKGNDPENIFQLYMLYDPATKEATPNFFGIFLASPYIHNKEDYKAWLPNPDYLDEIYADPNDIRLNVFFSQSAEQDLLLTKYDNVNYYDSGQPENFAISNNVVLFRLPEILLLKAEAESKLGNDGKAQQSLNLVRARANLPASALTGDELFDEIFAERQREFFGEGCLAYDMIRMNKLTMAQDRITLKGYYWPLDMRTLLPQDNLLTQNPYWKTH